MIDAHRAQINLRGVDAAVSKDARQPKHIEAVLGGVNRVGVTEVVRVDSGRDPDASAKASNVAVCVVAFQPLAVQRFEDEAGR